MLETVFISISAHPVMLAVDPLRCPNPQTVNVLPYAAKGFCKYAEIRDLEMGRLSWSVQVGPVQWSDWKRQGAGGPGVGG